MQHVNNYVLVQFNSVSNNAMLVLFVAFFPGLNKKIAERQESYSE